MASVLANRPRRRYSHPTCLLPRRRLTEHGELLVGFRALDRTQIRLLVGWGAAHHMSLIPRQRWAVSLLHGPIACNEIRQPRELPVLGSIVPLSNPDSIGTAGS